MKKISWNKNSIVFKLTVFVIFLIIAQSVLLIAAMIAGGILKQTEENAFQSFSEKVDSRKGYLQREMSNRWSNVDPYLKEISRMLPLEDDNNSTEQFLIDSAPILISMLRTTMTNGTFIILNDQENESNQHSTLYFRDYDPLLNDELNKDLYFVAGPFEISQKLRIPMDQSWSYSMELTDENRKFYDKPYLNASLSSHSALLGYWSPPFRLTPDDLPIVTYSMPIFDGNNEVRGVIGVEISINYFNQFLPATDLLARDSLGYLIGYKEQPEGAIKPMITNGALQKRMIQLDKDFSFLKEDEKRDIYLLENHNSQDKIYASVQKMGLYNYNTPFEEEEWYLIGLMEQNKLLSFVKKIQSILLISFLGSSVIGGVGGYFISYAFTKPIIHLAKQVRESDLKNTKTLTRIGLTEIDSLTDAMETANKNLLESTIKMSRIINLVEVPIGAFEYKEHRETVFATDQLKQLLFLEETEAEDFYCKKRQFINHLLGIMGRPEAEEENVYKFSDSPEKWLKIKMITDENSTLGIVIDVTKEIHEKNQIKLDRDHDMLTSIYNRGAFQRSVTAVLRRGDLNFGAFIMLDLDYLKQINDSYGHMWGDIYIKTTADLLFEFKKAGGIIGRQSGDEFSVFLFGFDSKDQIRALVEVFYEKLKANPIDFPEVGQREIMISAGLYWLDDNEENYNYEQLSQKADQALYKAKNKDKGSWKEFIDEDFIT
ncbi:diguanylate cyclase [Bacillaceae bacterium IKA-2]|nr:diguanylate cyclase [Bacillaceae bacterium IKA-2]